MYLLDLWLCVPTYHCLLLSNIFHPMGDKPRRSIEIQFLPKQPSAVTCDIRPNQTRPTAACNSSLFPSLYYRSRSLEYLALFSGSHLADAIDACYHDLRAVETTADHTRGQLLTAMALRSWERWSRSVERPVSVRRAHREGFVS